MLPAGPLDEHAEEGDDVQLLGVRHLHLERCQLRHREGVGGKGDAENDAVVSLYREHKLCVCVE